MEIPKEAARILAERTERTGVSPNVLRDLNGRIMKMRSAIIAKSNEPDSEAERAAMSEQLHILIAERAAFEDSPT